MINTSRVYQEYVVFVESKSLRGRTKEEYLRQVRKLAEYYRAVHSSSSASGGSSIT
jgi:hypothetical protein